MLIDVMTENPAHLPELIAARGVDAVFVPEERMTMGQLQDTVDACHRADKACILQLPYVFRSEESRDFLRREKEILSLRPDGFLVRSIDEAGFLAERGWPGLRIFDAGMYAWNSRARRTLRGMGADILTAPYELTWKELADLGLEGMEVVIYGRQPAMVTAQCVRLTETGCGKGREEYAFRPMKDRTGAVFLAQNRCRTCTNVIYNSVPLWMLDRDISTLDPGRVRLQFTDEKVGEPSRILKDWLGGSPRQPEHFTRGHKTL